MSRDGHNAALLFEITIVLLFFALSASVILGMFISAHDFSKQGRALNGAVSVAQEWAESLRGDESPVDYLTSVGFTQVADRYHYETDQGLTVAIALDSETTEVGQLWAGDIVVSDVSGVEATLPLCWYIPATSAAKGGA